MTLKKVINSDQSRPHEPSKGKWATHIFGRLVWSTLVIISDLLVTCQNLFNSTDSAIIGAWCASEIFFSYFISLSLISLLVYYNLYHIILQFKRVINDSWFASHKYYMWLSKLYYFFNYFLMCYFLNFLNMLNSKKKSIFSQFF
jgi:hypothetical protein